MQTRATQRRANSRLRWAVRVKPSGWLSRRFALHSPPWKGSVSISARLSFFLCCCSFALTYCDPVAFSYLCLVNAAYCFLFLSLLPARLSATGSTMRDSAERAQKTRLKMIKVKMLNFHFALQTEFRNWLTSVLPTPPPTPPTTHTHTHLFSEGGRNDKWIKSYLLTYFVDSKHPLTGFTPKAC